MRINLRERIAGQPASAIRNFLKRGFQDSWTLDFAIKALRADRDAARRVVSELVRRGLVEPDGRSIAGEAWKNTLLGNAFAGATAAAPLSRKSADQRLSEFLARVATVKNDPRFLYKVRRVTLFGSYLSSQDRINDIDLCVSLAPKEKDSQRQSELEERRIEDALRDGKSFDTFIDRLSWPQMEVLKFLKARSRSISLHTESDPILARCRSKVIYRDRAS